MSDGSPDLRVQLKDSAAEIITVDYHKLECVFLSTEDADSASNPQNRDIYGKMIKEANAHKLFDDMHIQDIGLDEGDFSVSVFGAMSKGRINQSMVPAYHVSSKLLLGSFNPECFDMVKGFLAFPLVSVSRCPDKAFIYLVLYLGLDCKLGCDGVKADLLNGDAGHIVVEVLDNYNLFDEMTMWGTKNQTL